MKVLVAMSGGVDSSVAAKLLQDKGYDCMGCTMKLYSNEDAGLPKQRTCCSLDDVEDARAVAVRLGMPYYVFQFTQEFRDKVMDKFVCAYENGLTPNPCIDCNRYMKFDSLLQRAQVLGCQYLATGHYARIERTPAGYVLKKALDGEKDQSYMLYTMTQEQLAHTLFPLGALSKAQTRQIAAQSGFLNAKKPDSQDICFVPDGDYGAMIRRYRGVPAQPGDFIDKNGAVLGRHAGIIYYTIGQHRGLGLSLPDRRYVCAIDPEKNTVTLGEKDELYRTEVFVEDVHWISGTAPDAPLRCRAKLRYRQPEQPVTVVPMSNRRAVLHFDQPQRAVTPGQAAVLYDADVVLGGGTIARQ